MRYDTEFLIRLAGQGGAKAKAAAEVFLTAQDAAQSYISQVAWSEFAEGCEHEAAADAKSGASVSWKSPRASPGSLRGFPAT
jgi:hypothetical protein